MIAFDLDGTLFESHLAPEEWDDPVRVRAGTAAMMERLCLLPRRGATFITGRTEAVRLTTEAQLREAGLESFTLVMQAKWDGYDALTRYKARWFLTLGVAAYVGDSESDRTAARTANARFYEWDEYEARLLGVRGVRA